MDFAQLLSESPDLIHQLAGLEREPFPAAPILFAKIKLLWQCNLSCVFCTLPDAGEPMPRKTVLTLLEELRKRGLRKVHYSGGEVFLHPEICAILEESCRQGLQVNLTTNGTLLDREKVRRLARMKVHSVSISLDAADSGLHDKLRCRKGVFKATFKAIELIASNGKKYPKLRVNTVATSRNIDQLDRIHQLLSTLPKVVHWKIIPVDTSSPKLRLNREMIDKLSKRAAGWTLLDEPPFESYQVREERNEKDRNALVKGKYGKRYYEDHRCYMPWLHLFIDPNGFVYPCCMSRGHIAAYGNIYQEPLAEILSGPTRRELLMDMASSHTMQVCRYCDDYTHENAMIDEAISNVNRASCRD
ncbi:MAG: radical SAM protein [bacterium]|nr:radical SAM protein [bacterium]